MNDEERGKITKELEGIQHDIGYPDSKTKQ